MDLKHKTSQILFALLGQGAWRSHDAAALRDRAGKIPAILPSTFILERIDAETYRFRLAGTNVCEMSAASCAAPTSSTAGRQPIASRSSVTLPRSPSRVPSRPSTWRRRPLARASTPFEVVLLPLHHTSDDVDRVLGAFSPLDPPHWLGELPLATKRIIAHELVWPAGGPNNVVQSDRGAQDASVLPARHARIVRSERRQFRVFEGGPADSDLPSEIGPASRRTTA